jgi:hypothetical protein
MLAKPIRITVPFACTADEKALLDKWAAAAGLSRSSYVRRALGFDPVE